MISRRDFLRLASAAGTAAALEACGTSQGRRDGLASSGKSLNREEIVRRHNPHITSIDPAAVLSVGNGSFAYNVDCTGLQSLPGAYNVIPLCTMSHWGWHTKPPPAGVDPATLRLKEYNVHGRTIRYPTDQSGQVATFNYMRENPHRLHLGRAGLLLDGDVIRPDQLSGIDQTLDLYTGIITSKFKLEGVRVEVITCCHGTWDVIGLRVTSPLCANGRLAIQVEFPYGSSASNGDGADWNSPALHQTTLSQADDGRPPWAELSRTLDGTRYTVVMDVSGATGTGGLRRRGPHAFAMAPRGQQIETVLWFSPGGSYRAMGGQPPTFAATADAARRIWRDYWTRGAAIDLSACTDARAPELERRIVLSQYLMAIHSAGNLPSQETGLLCNSWHGKFHLEMHWWHSTHFALWNRWNHFNRPMNVYASILPSARDRAQAQGFQGARWPKMTAPDAWAESPSTINPLIIWQQPHPIYFAEMAYRQDPTRATVAQWSEIVFATADFLASFAQPDGDRYVLGPAIRAVPENNSDTDINPTYELTAWRFGLETAQLWRARRGMRRNPDWDRVLEQLSPAPTADGVYLSIEGQPTFTPQWAYEHPAMLGALGALPGNNINPATMAATVRRVSDVWDFTRVWGWDFGLAAMAAARTGQPQLALDFLLMDSPKNRYLPNGCNFQTDALPAYFPGNGGLLAAIALMAAGWQDGPTQPQGPLPGFPKNGKWNIRAEGFSQIL